MSMFFLHNTAESRDTLILAGHGHNVQRLSFELRLGRIYLLLTGRLQDDAVLVELCLLVCCRHLALLTSQFLLTKILGSEKYKDDNFHKCQRKGHDASLHFDEDILLMHTIKNTYGLVIHKISF